MPKHQVALFFRKRRENANFSMETSFECMMEKFPIDSEFTLRKFISSYFSNAIFPRIHATLEASRHGTDVNHVTGEVHFLALGLPRKKTILTVHDCGFMTHPNPVLRRLLKWFWLDWPVRHSRYVTAVSEATKADIVRYTGCRSDKVVVIPTVIAETFQRSDKTFDEACPRILHIGMAPNKNFERHVAAISGLRCRLHIVGKISDAHVRLLEMHDIAYTAEHNVSRAEVFRAYQECDLLLFASTREGFGMPILEAQSVGRPVVTSNLSSMPEVAGDGACLVDPFDVDSIRAGVDRIISDVGFRSDLVRAGFDNTRRFSADTVARQYESLYRRVVSDQ